jgi:hypothetical protein
MRQTLKMALEKSGEDLAANLKYCYNGHSIVASGCDKRMRKM